MNGAATAQTGWSVDTTNSTDTSIVTVSGHIFTFVRAGLYSFSLTSSLSAVGPNAYQTTTTDPEGNAHVLIGPFAGVAVGSVPIPTLRIIADTTPLYVWVSNQHTADTQIQTRRVRISRLA